MAQVSEVMTRGVRVLSPQDTMRLAAQAMDELDVGSIPVCDGTHGDRSRHHRARHCARAAA